MYLVCTYGIRRHIALIDWRSRSCAIGMMGSRHPVRAVVTAPPPVVFWFSANKKAQKLGHIYYMITLYCVLRSYTWTALTNAFVAQ
jgi:hypothetical protein